ncbi:hypothetical protein AWB72_01811 [Caballeronia concitans]|uniref:Uncharacterized protein n=1 Tax=Caballeronia concitans TaxID=1777133 RepID=A0A658QUU1_9BURK|nr:hypothetical protein BurMR1_3284 [Burkholderia sp. MR1]SAL24038.1 hypothetical protein AWB72_01811 [Caballeronia concitans]
MINKVKVRVRANDLLSHPGVSPNLMVLATASGAVVIIDMCIG